MKLATALCVLGLAACAPKPAPDDLFPLNKGLAWTYDVSYAGDQADDLRPAETWEIVNQGTQSWDNQTVAVRRHSAGVSYLLQTTAEGVNRVAHQTDVDAEPVPDELPLPVIRTPAEVGMEWTTPTRPQLLRRKLEFPAELKHSHEVLMTWRIEATDDAVILGDQTPVSNCVRVRGEGRLNLFTDPVNGFNDVPLVSTEWYCPGVGLAKLVRTEKVPAGFLLGGTLTALLREKP